jgi:Flp pilus assembly protein TadG
VRFAASSGPADSSGVEAGRVSTESGGDGGGVTVEAALVLPLIVAVAAACIAALAVMATQLRCVDAAEEAARMFGRGDRPAASAAVAALAGAATLELATEDQLVRAVVTTRPLGGLLPGVSVSATAFAVREPAPGAQG